MASDRQPASAKREAPRSLFATAAPGLEAALLAEVRDLPGAAEARAVPGGVEFWGDEALLYRANLQLRGAGRVLLRLLRFRASRFEEVVDAAAAVQWERYLRTAAVQAKVTCHACRLYHSGAVAERLEGAIRRRLPAPPPDSEDGPGAPPLVLLRGVRDEWELSLDTSGDLLHFRGYRQDAVAAPLRENLAAALLLHAGYRGGPVWDLCCGSGTFLIEAALLRRRIAPGLFRRFACQRWPSFDQAAFAAVKQAARDAILRDPLPSDLHGVDLDPRAIAGTAANAERAEVGADLLLRCADLFHAPAPEGTGLVIANPPYGKRLHPGAGRALFTRLGRHLLQRFAGWQALILCPQQAGPPELAQRLGLRVLIVPNGGLPIAALTGRLPHSAVHSH